MDSLILIFVLLVIVLLVLLASLVSVVAIRTMREQSSKNEEHTERLVKAVMDGAVDGLGKIAEQMSNNLGETVVKVSDAAFRPIERPDTSDQKTNNADDTVHDDNLQFKDWTDSAVGGVPHEKVASFGPGDDLFAVMGIERPNDAGETYSD